MTVKPDILTTFTLISVSFMLLAGCGESEQAKLEPAPQANGPVAAASTDVSTPQAVVSPTTAAQQPAEATSPGAKQPGRDPDADRGTTRGSRNIGAVNGSVDPAAGEKDARDAAPGSGGDPAATTAGVSTASTRVSIPAPAEPTGRTGTDPGDTIMEIEGEDLDEERFALSDYEGKVIMLDFWGDW